MKRIFLAVTVLLFLNGCVIGNRNDSLMIDLTNMSLSDTKEYAKKNNLKLEINEEYSDMFDKDKVISQNIEKNTLLKENIILKVTISKGPIPLSYYKENNINELGNVPIMMYHSIVDKPSVETGYIGGNVDKNGYSRTKEAFINDLEMYYQKNYRMIRLIDYMNGNVNVSFGKSPIILTFDDGNKDNFNVLGLDEKNNIIIDPNCAVGVLEAFKEKYKDFNITATFFLNDGLFGQPKYNEMILKWLVDNGYDIGNHTKDHVDFSKIDANKTQEEIAYMYNLLDGIIPNKYQHIVALPFGSPYKKSHNNFNYILSGIFNEYNYATEGTLQVGWDANFSPFHKNFDKTFMKRTRAWDNNGTGFDITMVFNNLEKDRYISDGNINTIVIANDTNLNLNIKNRKIIKY